ncbi:MAG TPA: hypothetical protein VIK86_08600, partial [Candidatus Paceibacterota bacterium]
MSEKYFPLLHGNNDFIEAVKSVHLAQKSVIDITTRIQGECEHDFDETLVEDKNYIWDAFSNSNKKVLDSKTCEKCGFEVKRPSGSPWQICHKCWSSMRHEDTIPGQGERTFVYKCNNTKCGHV